MPHFEKMTYDNSELLKNFLHGYQVTGEPLFRETAEGIIEWVGEVLSDRERGGFYGSQDADQTLDDDGDYFTWTVAEVRAVLTSGRIARDRDLLRREAARRDASQSCEKCFVGHRHIRGAGHAARHGRNRRAPLDCSRKREAARCAAEAASHARD